MSHGLGRRAATIRRRTVCGLHAYALLAVPALWRPHAHRRSADRASALRFSIFTKKKRNAATWRRTVSGRIFRSRTRYAWYDRKCV
ncbi:MAG TPA: hypothetical protein VK595_10195 [Vicinamibacterales bacterium]|nr:hypothetical protein [Vicinamibacterales bacterium]